MIGERVAREPQFFRRVGEIPRRKVRQIQFVPGIGSHLRQIAPGVRFRAFRKLVQELENLVRRIRHLGFE
ncbi:hypothetical protein D3C83_149670 [compost metagenome]